MVRCNVVRNERGSIRVMAGAIAGEVVGVNEAARMLGVNASTVSRQLDKLVGLGALTVSTRGRQKVFDLADFKRAFDAHCNPLKARQGGSAIALGFAAGPAAAAAAPADPGDDAPAPAAASAAPSSFAAASADERRVKAQREQLKLDRELGRVVDRQAVEGDLQTAARKMRDALLAMPARLKGELASMTNPAEIGGLLDREVRAVLEALANDFTQVGRMADQEAEGSA